MTTTSANLDDLAAFVNGSTTALNALVPSLNGAITKANTVAGNCTFNHPSTPSLTAAATLLGNWQTNSDFVATVHEAILAADAYDADGNGSVDGAAVDQALAGRGLDQAPGPIDVAEVEMFGQPPYSGFRDDPIGMANGNLLLRAGDLSLPGIAASLAVIRAYNSRDRRDGAFGTGWTSLVDVGLLVEDRRTTFRGPDGGGSVFHLGADGTWIGGDRRRHALTATLDGWEVADGPERSWRFDADGRLIGFTARAADVAVDRGDAAVRFHDRTSGRWVLYRIDPDVGRVTSVATSDGRTVAYAYAYDDERRVVPARGPEDDITYAYDDAGFLAEVRDADGVVLCRNTYDGLGRVLTQVDHRRRTSTYEYRADGVSRDVADDGGPPNVMVHDRRGRMTAMIDGLGNAMRCAYDDADNLVQLVDRTGAVTRYDHDQLGNVVSRTDPDGTTSTWEWDERGRVLAHTDRAGGTSRFEYATPHREPTRVLQPDGSEFRMLLDDRGLPTEVVDADGVTARVEWDRDGLATALVDGLGDRIGFEYDATGRTTGLVAPDGVRAEVDLDAAGRVLALRTDAGVRRFSYTDAGRAVGGVHESGTAWTAELDPAGDIAALADTGGRLVTYQRDPVGRVVATVAPDGATARIEHDPLGRVIATVDPAGHRTEVDHDPEGRPVQITDPIGRTWSRELDVLGRPTVLVEPDGATSIRSYHPNGELATVTDHAGNQWSYEVDAMGRVVAATDPLGAVTTYRYTPGGRLAEVRSPLGRTTRHEHDAAGRLVRITTPDGRTTSLAPDPGAPGADGRVADGRVAVDLDRDARGLLSRAVDATGLATEFAHDANGRLVAQRTDGAGTGFEWDAAGRLAAVIDPYGNRTAFQYDGRGAVTRIDRPDGTSTVRSFGPDGRIAAAHDGEGNRLVAFRRDANGRIVAAEGPSARLAIRRDVLGRPTEVATDAGIVRYERDADGAVTSIADGAGFRADLVRDVDGRFVGFTAGSRQVARPADVDDELARDDEGRIVEDEHGRTHAYDLAGRLAATTVDGATTTFDYDDRGLLTTERSADGVRTYRYGTAGELFELAEADGTTTTFSYDANGRRVGAAGSDGTRTAYRYDLLGNLVEVARTAPDGSVERHEIHRDPFGRPVAVDAVPILWESEATGGLLGIGDERYLWWGRHVLVATDPDADWSRRVTDDPWGHDGGRGVRLGYRGELAVDDLLLLGDRAYDTRTRTFLSPDPAPPVLGSSGYPGRYVYAWNDPVNLVDPTGRNPISDEDYAAMREQAGNGWFENTWNSIKEDPWRFVGKVAVGVVSVGVMAVATVTLGPVGLVLAGAAVGAISAGLNGAIDGKSWQDIGRDMLIGGAMGAAGGVVGRFVPTSAVSGAGQRIVTNLAWNAAAEYPMAAGEELLDSYIPGGDGTYEWSNVAINGTINTIGGTAVGEVGYRTTQAADARLADPTRDRWVLQNASAEGFQQIPGIGPVLSERIVEYRNSQSLLGLRDAEQLLDVRGIGPARYEAITGSPPP